MPYSSLCVFVATPLAIFCFSAQAQLRVLPDQAPQRVFCREAQKLSLVWQNTGAQPVSLDLRARLYQASSATAVPIGEVQWKRLEMLPHQTALESATLNFPEVRGETRFIVQWLGPANRVSGTTEVLVYPTNLLSELKPLAGDQPLGLFGPVNDLGPLLKALGVEYVDLTDTGLIGFTGRLAVIDSSASEIQASKDLKKHVKALARKGAAVLWIEPPPERNSDLKPSFYVLPEGRGALIIVQADLVANLLESPQAQLNLIRLARLARNPEPPRLPGARR